MKNMHTESAMRPNESKNHVSATNAELWESIENDGKWVKTAMTDHFDALKWFSVDNLAYKDTTDGKKTSREYFMQTSSSVETLSELKENYKAFAAFMTSIAEAANAEALKQFHALASEDENYEQIMKLTDNLSVEWSLNQKQSGKLVSKEIIKTKEGKELTFFKYSVDTEKMSFNQAITVFEKAKTPIKYQTEIAKAKAAEEARLAEQKKQADEIAELRAMVAKLMAEREKK